MNQTNLLIWNRFILITEENRSKGTNRPITNLVDQIVDSKHHQSTKHQSSKPMSKKAVNPLL